jgi:hypothetical protein
MRNKQEEYELLLKQKENQNEDLTNEIEALQFECQMIEQEMKEKIENQVSNVENSYSLELQTLKERIKECETEVHYSY